MPYASKEDVKAYQREWIRQRRLDWIQEHGPCQTCGSWDDLEVDHKDSAEKEIPVRSLWGMSPTNPRRIAELAKCQVLCHGCHAAKTAREDQKHKQSLTKSQVREIRILSEKMCDSDLGRKYGVSGTTIGRIRTSKTWAWLT